MNVLFLDFDGPLFPQRVLRFHPDNHKPYPGKLSPNRKDIRYWRMDEVAVAMLNRLYNKHQFETVISSTWRLFCDKEYIEELFEVNGLELKLAEDWATNNYTFRSCRRLEEVNDYVMSHSVDDCIILDDKMSGSSLHHFNQSSEHYEELGKNPFSKLNAKNVIIVDYSVGIEEAHYWRMLDIVKRWNGEKVLDTDLFFSLC